MHIHLISQRHSSETKVVAVTLNLSTIVEALVPGGWCCINRSDDVNAQFCFHLLIVLDFDCVYCNLIVSVNLQIKPISIYVSNSLHI